MILRTYMDIIYIYMDMTLFSLIFIWYALAFSFQCV